MPRISKHPLLLLVAIGLILCRRPADAQTAWTSVNQSSVQVGQSVNVTVYVDSGGEGLFEAWANWHDPSGDSGILWSTFINYYYQTPWYTTGACTLTSVGTWWFDAYGYTGDYPRSQQVITGGYAATYAAPAAPSVGSGSVSVAQGQTVSYQISASNNPTSYGATNLPGGLSLNTSTGVISGTITTNLGAQDSNTTVTTTISATNAYGTSSATVTWYITAAVITPSASVSPASISYGQSVTLTRDGSTNFGLGWTENVIWHPDGSAEVLGNMGYGSMTYTPSAGPGIYWYQFRLVDTYYNFIDQFLSITVAAVINAPTSLQVTSAASTSVTLSWSGASATNGIGYYNVFRNGVLLGTTTGTSYTDATAQPGTTYTYSIQTVDSDGNVSSGTISATATTLGDLELFTPLP